MPDHDSVMRVKSIQAMMMMMMMMLMMMTTMTTLMVVMVSTLKLAWRPPITEWSVRVDAEAGSDALPGPMFSNVDP